MKLLKEKCIVKVFVLSNKVVKALMKSKSSINDKIRSGAVEQVIKLFH
ncbi:hypothetical protein [Clostridium sp.]|nr:hypothetical protein [Clostridium sp.]